MSNAGSFGAPDSGHPVEPPARTASVRRVAHDLNNALAEILGCAGLARARIADDHPAARHLWAVEAAAARAAALADGLLTGAPGGAVTTGAVRRTAEARVLALDESPGVRRTVERILRRAGYQPLVVETAAAALDLLAGDEAVDLVLLDPDVGGPRCGELRERLTRGSPRPPVVLMTDRAADEPHVPDTGLRVRKPFTPRELLAVVDGALLVRGRATRAAAATVLVADDDGALLATCRSILEGAGHRVLTAGDGAEALERYGPAVDLVLLDILMPGMDGPATMDALLRRDPRARVLFFCGARIDEIGPRLVAAGARGVVRKPLQAEALVDAVRRALDEP